MRINMQAKDFLNFVSISTHLTGKRDNIRKDKIPKKNESQIKELTDFIEYWRQKHPVKN